MSMRYQAGIVLPGYNALKVANAPTIGTATAGTSNCASVTFTAPACVGGGAISGYTVFSNCGAFRNSGASSPVVVSGLTTGSSYTFKAIATNAYGPSYPSAASNSITAAVATCATYTTAGTFSWVAPSGVTSVAVVTVGGGGHGAGRYKCGCYERSRGGGGGGALAYANAISVTPGSSYTVVVGAGGQTNCSSGGQSYFNTTSTVRANGGVGGSVSTFTGGAGGTVGAGTGGAGGKGGNGCGNASSGAGSGGGGAGGYSGAGGESCGAGSQSYGATGGSGGAGGGGSNSSWPNSSGGGGGGGVGIFGEGASGAAIPVGSTGGGSTGGNGGSSGTNGTAGTTSCSGGLGGTYGGGSGSTIRSTTWQGNVGGGGAVRIVWAGSGRGTPSFPSTNVGP